jgi:3-oxoacyl-[acyl-carrier-protein] synthase-3
MAGRSPNFKTNLTGSGSCLPERIVDNHEISSNIITPPEFADKPTDDAWIQEVIGIKRRGIADPEKGETTAYLGAEACRLALEMAGLDPKSIEMLILATTSEDMEVPATASDIQEILGLENAFVFDINVACPGFVYGLAISNAMMSTYG